MVVIPLPDVLAQVAGIVAPAPMTAANAAI
jgi:hypothetical protein